MYPTRTKHNILLLAWFSDIILKVPWHLTFCTVWCSNTMQTTTVSRWKQHNIDKLINYNMKNNETEKPEQQVEWILAMHSATVWQLKFITSIFGQSGSSCPYKWLLVGPTASKTRSSQSVTVSLLSKRPSLFCLIHFGGPWGQLRGRRHPSMEDDLRWKTSIDGRRPSMEDDLRWKTTFERRPSMEDNLRFKMTFDGRWSLMEDNLWWKMIFKRRRPSIEDDLRWKTTFDGRRPLMEDDLR